MSLAFWICLLLLSIAAGMSSALFLHALDFTEHYRPANINIYYLLPFAALLSAHLYKRWGSRAIHGSNVVIEEIHSPKEKIPLIQSVLVFFCSFISHLSGASVGREGVAVQMSSSIADTIIAKFTLSKSERKHLLLSAVAAGFSSILFAPLAGAAFAMEISTQGKWEWKSAPYFILSSFIALAVTNLLFTHQSALSILAHTQAFTLTFPQTTFDILAAILIGFFCAMFERIFVFLVKTMKNIFSKLSFHPYSGALIGSIVLLTIYRLAPYTQKFSGLGLTTIFYAFIEKSSWFDSIGKLIFTSFSIATGFQGGEIVPLLFMGSTLCSFLLSISPVPLSASLIAAAFPAVLSAACNTPMACSLLACELFGWNILPYSLLTCFTAYFFASKTGIYRTQLKLSKRWPYCPWKN